MISLKPIRENAGAPAYTRGNQVYKRGLVHKLKVENQGGLILVSALEAIITGTKWRWFTTGWMMIF